MNAHPRIGFVGFGEAGFHIGGGLSRAGIGGIRAFDIHSDTPGLGKKIRQRAEETGTQLVDSNAELTGAADIVISTVTANQALAAAHQTAARIGRGPAIRGPEFRVSLAQADDRPRDFRHRGRFVEVAVMAPAPPYGHKVPMLVGGAGGAEFVERMTPVWDAAGIHFRKGRRSRGNQNVPQRDRERHGSAA